MFRFLYIIYVMDAHNLIKNWIDRLSWKPLDKTLWNNQLFKHLKTIYMNLLMKLDLSKSNFHYNIGAFLLRNNNLITCCLYIFQHNHFFLFQDFNIDIQISRSVSDLHFFLFFHKSNLFNHSLNKLVHIFLLNHYKKYQINQDMLDFQIIWCNFDN